MFMFTQDVYYEMWMRQLEANNADKIKEQKTIEEL
jgi:hypothetical protein